MKVQALLICLILVLGTGLICLASEQDTAQQGKLYGVYDGNWGLAYYMKDQALYDTNWELQYYVRGDVLYDKYWRKSGIIKGSDIYDDHNYLRYRIKEWKPPEGPGG